MEIIQLSKDENGRIIRTNRSIDHGRPESIKKLFLDQGTVCLVRRYDHPRLEEIVNELGVLNCGIKEDKIHLLRALKLVSETRLDLPRRIIFNSKNSGGLKKSLVSLMNQYLPNFPSSIVYIPDQMFGELFNAKDRFLLTVDKKDNDPDPLVERIFWISQLPEVKKLGEEFIGESADMVFVRAKIYIASQKNSPVLILGESGTGKDIVANKIYELSNDYHQGFIRVNCSALPDTLFESELFGYVKGAFTDAKTNKDGLLKEASGSTVFLDEIGDLSLPNQAKLLHAIEDKEIRPIGSNESFKVDFRIIAATNRRLDIMMKHQKFRTDLYHRLNSISIYIPPLRAHFADIPKLAQTIWKKDGYNQKLTPDFLDSLQKYSWPGNVRELKTTLRSISDFFGDTSPTPAQLMAIQKQHTFEYEDKQTNSSMTTELLWVESRNRMVEVLNILASIKIEINKTSVAGKKVSSINNTNGLKMFLANKFESVTKICEEPIYFRKWDLSNLIMQYREFLGSLLHNWPNNKGQVQAFWQHNMESLDNQINQEIFQVVYGKRDD